MAAPKKFALGRGLDALISADEPRTEGSSSINEIELDKISANADQPRKDFDEDSLMELANSIRSLGIITPITVQKFDEHHYQIIAGERRYRAAKLAGLTKIPCYIREGSDQTVLEMALTENLQRQDLNPIEIALAYQFLAETYSLTQEALGDRVGKSRTAVTNHLRLLKLPAEVQVALKDKRVDVGHARALLSLSSPIDQIKLFEEIVRRGFSVREVEAKVREMLSAPKAEKNKVSPSEKSVHYEQLLSNIFTLYVKISTNSGGKGKLIIPFKNEKELEAIMKIIAQQQCEID